MEIIQMEIIQTEHFTITDDGGSIAIKSVHGGAIRIAHWDEVAKLRDLLTRILPPGWPDCDAAL